MFKALSAEGQGRLTVKSHKSNLWVLLYTPTPGSSDTSENWWCYADADIYLETTLHLYVLVTYVAHMISAGSICSNYQQSTFKGNQKQHADEFHYSQNSRCYSAKLVVLVLTGV